ncbi:MAG TPA: urocanate hydratase [Candidatus Izemoplasmatales bacterium]|nr:urocanate hydratase [Candidatus Izemoplasmatales bacterium]
MTKKHPFSLKDVFPVLPDRPAFVEGIRRAPKRQFTLTPSETELALNNAMRYIPPEWQKLLAEEFLEELLTRGRIYGYRFRPSGRLYGKPVDQYPGNTLEGRACQVMIDNNLDFEVALYPYELVTYGETGSVLQNWMQYHFVKYYLQEMNDRQTLVMMSGHPLGLFDSLPGSPRVLITNGLMVGMYDRLDQWNRAAQLGVASYGQMTAGGWMYIGPQGIVHGTYSTLLNAGRSKLHLPLEGDLGGKMFVSSGLGGMSGAQGKACVIAGGVAVIAEVDESRIRTRKDQGWVDEVVTDPGAAFMAASTAIGGKEARAIAFHGNIVTLLEYACCHRIPIDLLSDQTSCHAVYEGGYCPVDLTFDQRTAMLKDDPDGFRTWVDRSLKRHYEAIRELVGRGTYFFDYGNSFLKALFDSGITEICKNGHDDLDGFVWPSYVEDIMGPFLFDYGYGPFRWVCLSGKDTDLEKTDAAAMACIDPSRRFQDRDNYNWIRDAKKNRLTVGTKARILYQDALGRLRIAKRFNAMVRAGEVGPIMLGRDHHDCGGTDSPFRETANIRDGSNVMADMATQVALGNASRGMTLVALHNGGGVGIGKAINGGFGMVLDGSEHVDAILESAMTFDVMAGVSRRAWARNEHAVETAKTFNDEHLNTTITLPQVADEDLIHRLVAEKYRKGGY